MIQCQRADQLSDRLGVLIAEHHAIGAEIVEMIAELDDIEGWQGDGYRSQSHWLSVRGSYTMSEASRFAPSRGASSTSDPSMPMPVTEGAR